MKPRGFMPALNGQLAYSTEPEFNAITSRRTRIAARRDGKLFRVVSEPPSAPGVTTPAVDQIGLSHAKKSSPRDRLETRRPGRRGR